MGSERLIFFSGACFISGWGCVAFLYLVKVIPAIKKRHGWRAVFEASLQYGVIARQENDKRMVRTFYLLNILVTFSVVARASVSPH